MCNAEAAALRRREELARVEHELLKICRQLCVGDKIPTHSQLMRRLTASERTVLRALERLTQSGAIIRKHGSGTYVAQASRDHTSCDIQQASRTVIAALARPGYSLYDNLLRTFHQCLQGYGADLLCLPVVQGHLPDIALPNRIAVFGYEMIEEAVLLQGAGKRVVMIGSPPAGQLSPVSSVTGWHRAAEQVIALLGEHGHHNIAVVNLESNLFGNLPLNGIGMLSPVALSSHPVRISIVPFAETQNWHRNRDSVRTYFCTDDAPTALVVANEELALSIMSTLQWAGIDVPHDVSVVGIGSGWRGEVAHPSLTTLDPQLDKVMRLATELLLSPVETTLPIVTEVMPRLVVRQSSATVRATVNNC